MAVVASLPGFEPHAACVAPPAAQSERLARLRLARSENVGPRSFLHLIERFGTAVVALDALPDLAAAGGRRGYVVCPTAAAEDEVLTGEAAGASLVLLGDAAYPARLLSIGSPPPALWMLGDPGVLTAPAVAVVGARNASALGLRQARRLGQALAEAGQLVVSGLARGIDHAAHEGALAAAGPGASTTVAVLPGGIDRVYPEEHLPLVRRIADAGGAVIAEAPPGTEPRSRHFPRRNRLVSGLSDGVVIVEAAERSGSLITARSALDQGREV
ncbi:MAG: DNA-processing protein DprA, partial [Pseudomonadota bacterium]